MVTYVLDESKIVDKATLLVELARVFGFPDYFGHNWDALNDCLGDIASNYPIGSIQIVWDTRGSKIDTATVATMQSICEGHQIGLVCHVTS